MFIRIRPEQLSDKKYSFITRAACVLFASLALAACMPKVIVEAERRADDLVTTGALRSKQLFGEDYSLHYVDRGGVRDPAFVFIHGTPGDWRIFVRQLEDQALIEGAHLVALDRPGWGGSTIPKGEAHIETDFSEQARYISYLLVELRKRNQGKAVVLVGHSLGATLSVSIAMEYPDLVDGVVAIAGDLASTFAEPEWYNKLASTALVHAVLPKDMCFANDEVIALPGNLNMMKPNWKNLSVPMLVIQGDRDELVDPRNAEFAAQLNTQSSVTVERFADAGHLLLLTHAGEINALLREFLDKITAHPPQKIKPSPDL